MTKAPKHFASTAAFCAALLLMLGLGAQSAARADEFAAANAALLDPFDPVPQIRFSDCYADCGYHDCYEDCGYRHCYDRCGYHHRCCWHHRWGGDFGRHRLWTEDAVWWQRIYEHDFNTDRWNGAMQRYTNQADRYDHYMGWGPTGPHDHGPDPADYEWRQDGDHWHYWHEHAWHDDGDGGRWHDGHHDHP
jgi:hypothetical protein